MKKVDIYHCDDDCDCVGTEPGKGLTRNLLDSGDHQEDVDEDHDETDGGHGQVEVEARSISDASIV